MKLNVIIFGSTGMLGRAALLECIDSPIVESVLLVNRSSLGFSNTKVKEIIHKDFLDFSPLKNEFRNYNACFFCLGVTALGLSEEEYTRVTYDITLAAANTLKDANPEVTLCYISGAGTDSSEKGRQMWARVKGRTENKLICLFKNAFMFRPGYIQPLKGIRSKTTWYQTFYTLFKPLYYFLKPFNGLVTDSVSLSQAMINVCVNGYPKSILEVKDINLLAKKKGSIYATPF